MTKLDRRTFIKTTAIASASALFSPALIGRAYGQSKIRLTVASLLGEDKPETLIWYRIRDLIEAQLPGVFDFSIVSNAALGGEKEVAEGIRLGAIQGSLSTVSALSSWVPEAQILDLPFLFRDSNHVRAAVTGETGNALKQKLASQNFVALDFINYGARHLLTKSPVTRPDQLSGQRIRVIQSPLHTNLWSAFGATPIGIPIPETYNALQTGVADAMDLTKSAYAGFKLYEVVPCLTETGHIWASGVIYFSAAFWNGLKAVHQQALEEAAQDGAAYFNALMIADEERSIAEAAEHGGQIFQAENRSEWENGANAVWHAFADSVGGFEKIEQIRDMA